jgi:hypothetical protein
MRRTTAALLAATAAIAVPAGHATQAGRGLDVQGRLHADAQDPLCAANPRHSRPQAGALQRDLHVPRKPQDPHQAARLREGLDYQHPYRVWELEVDLRCERRDEDPRVPLPRAAVGR